MENMQRIYEISCGALVLVLTGCLGIMWLVIKRYEEKANIACQKRIKEETDRIFDAWHQSEMKNGKKRFVEMFKAHERIKKLETENADLRKQNDILRQTLGAR